MGYEGILLGWYDGKEWDVDCRRCLGSLVGGVGIGDKLDIISLWKYGWKWGYEFGDWVWGSGIEVGVGRVLGDGGKVHQGACGLITTGEGCLLFGLTAAGALGSVVINPNKGAVKLSQPPGVGLAVDSRGKGFSGFVYYHRAFGYVFKQPTRVFDVGLGCNKRSRVVGLAIGAAGGQGLFEVCLITHKGAYGLTASTSAFGCPSAGVSPR
ncbi:hypothetical protein Tco_1043903 [Tanacetum coccineum]|uniref:Uncharacterized protein n=1 Tax=Tanacetum coccineum TaxID=301880 RepID=A0ABQ5GNP9_9ASTR